MIIDSHCHLHDSVFSDLRATLTRAIDHEVWGVIAVGCDPATNAKTLEAATHHGKAIWPCLGCHPEWTRLTDAAVEEVESQVVQHHSRIVALGEVGLPWYCLEGAPDPASLMVGGRERLGRFLELAARYDLPVILHAPHGAAVEALSLLRRHAIERAVFHWHKAPTEVTRQIVEAGYHVSVTPEVVYRQRDREMVEWIPLESLLVETDSPWPYQGEFEGLATEPWMTSRVVEEVAKLKQLPVDEVMFRLSTNTCQLFDLPYA
ncbi:MAG: TatD family hydrolase [Candidatus Rokubacteria bacterium]|nr:TatD family hydrolase [Candidatus Rokubacteria bacterium]